MRIARLELAAFGPFTERCLDFSGGAPGGLHLVYGRNAAGKSSALRAVSDLLFGVPSKSNDDHVHPYSALRIRALIERSTGERMLVQRLKRSKDSLRDEHDVPLDELVLKHLLGSVDRAMFERVFGLDHERLRDAGRALLEGGGDVGESLFDAGAGGQGVRRVLSGLRDEAERLFKPRGGKQEIAQLLERYKAARERVRDASHPPEAFVEQQRELERQHAECVALSRELSACRGEREHDRLLLTTLKGIAHRQKLVAELELLGHLPELPDGFSQRRERVQANLATYRINVERAEREVQRLLKRSSEIRPPSDLLAVGEETMALLREGIGSTKKALLDLPARRSALAERRAEVQIMERRLGVDSTLASPEALRGRRAGEARFRKLLAEKATRAERHRALRERLAEADLDLETHKARLAAMPPPEDAAELEGVVQAARHAGDLESALETVRRERAELELLSTAELGTLAPFAGTLDDLCRLRVPSAETMARFEKGFAEVDERRRRAGEDFERCRLRSAELTQRLAAEELAGQVPSEEDLWRARRTRDAHFDELSQRPGPGADERPWLFEAAHLRRYRESVVAADVLADRLRREASRVVDRARRVAELEQIVAEQRRLTDLLVKLEKESERLERAWTESWASAGFQPQGPGEMRGWIARRERAVELAIRRTQASERQSLLEGQARELSLGLKAVLGELPTDSRLVVGVALAEEKLESERRLRTQRAALEARIAELEVRSAAAARELRASEQEMRERDAEIARAVQALGFEATLAAEEVEARLEALADLLRSRDQASELERRITGIERDLSSFESEVTELVRAYASDLAGLAVWQAAAEIVIRFDRGRRDAETLDRLVSELEERRAELEEQRVLLAHAQSEAQELLTMSGADDTNELLAIESRTRKARELRAELDGLEATLNEAAGPQGLQALIEQGAATDPARLSARLAELDGSIEQLEERYSDSIRSHQRVQAGLELFADTSAVFAAEEERALAASIVVRVERWAKLKLAEVLLAREIERYREQNQGPVLRRAAELFARLTHGEYQGLRVGREERSLVAVRQSDVEVTVEGLNEAARYHLYLALRLASLERYLEHAEPLPLVLDDILIHFDEEGARAALCVLDELSHKVQILLFTHHRHVLELGKAAARGDRLFLHEL